MEGERKNDNGKFETPVFTKKDSLSYKKMKEHSKELVIPVIPLEYPDGAVTKPAPATLMHFYSAVTSEIVSEEALKGFDNKLLVKIIRLIDPFLTGEEPATGLSAAIWSETNRIIAESGDFETGEQMISIAEKILDTIIIDMFKEFKKALTDNTNPIAIEKYLRDCWNKVICHKNRQTLLQEFQKFIYSAHSKELRTNVMDSFILSMINIHTQSENEADFEPSEGTKEIFRKTAVPYPTKATRNPAVLKSSSSKENHFIRLFLESEINHSIVAEQALQLLDEFQYCGILPFEILEFTEEKFINYCRRLYVVVYELKEKAESEDMEGAMVGLWNEIVGPQLILVAELLLPDSQFLLPKV